MHPYMHAEKTPDKPCYIMAETGEVVTYKELEDRTNQAAQLFRKHGLVAGDSIAIFMENNARFFELCWAAQRAGLYFTAVSSRLTAGEIDYIVNDCEAKLFFTSKALAPVAEELVGHGYLKGVKARFMINGKDDGYESYEENRNSMPTSSIGWPDSG